ncbi:MAG: 4Fe-4S ferredoxin [Verrucomicrobia bacterium]|nr:4Fe-4S ferredoxin [Verrucomicrobiota bacterium]
MDVDIACVGFGPATGGFLTTLSKRLLNDDGTPALESRVMPGMPLQVMCYERGDDTGFGVSGLVTKADSIKASFPGVDLSEIPMAAAVTGEKLVYLLDPHGASRRSRTLRAADSVIKGAGFMLPFKDHGFALPYIPGFMNKEGGYVLSIGQFTQWVASQVMASGTVQVWPGTPAVKPLFEGDKVAGIRLIDQGADKLGNPVSGFMPGMDIKAGLTVVGDGPVGAVGRELNSRFGFPDGHSQREWAVGMKVVVDLPESTGLEPGMVFHTFGYPEPEIFGFFYVHPDRIASAGIFVPSSFGSPVRTAYRYLQHWMRHPYLWRFFEGARMRSWGAKTLQESGKRGEPYLVGDGFARIGEGSGTTNALTGSGVDEAWESGVQLAEGVIELAKAGKPFTKENLDAAYVERRRNSRLEIESKIAEKSRDGFQRGFVSGLIGMGLAGFSKGKMSIHHHPARPQDQVRTLEDYFCGRIAPSELRRLRQECEKNGTPLFDAVMKSCGWPEIPNDGRLFVSHQDALLLGGKVQAPGGYADHVVFRNPELCKSCRARVCVELCSGQAIMPGDEGIPVFDREKCIHCGACLWNCSVSNPDAPEKTNVSFRAGTGGLHSSEN